MAIFQYKVEIQAEAADALVVSVLKDMYENFEDDFDKDDEAKRSILRVIRFFMTKGEYQSWCQQLVEGKEFG